MDKFKGKVVIVTGGSRGLGEAMSKGFASEGAKVVVASRKLETCEKVVNEIKGAGGQAIAISAHMGDTDQLDALIEAAYHKYGRADILVNNAGINVGQGLLSDLSVGLFDKMYEVNLRGPWYLASRLAPKMAEQGGGCIINILSVAGLINPENMGFYAATKAGLRSLTEVMAQEWAPMNIRVNALAPGSYHSDLTDGALNQIPGFEENALKISLIKRIAETEEILNPIYYLATESFTTGITLVADGGLMANR